MAKDNRLRRRPSSKLSRAPRYLLPPKARKCAHPKRKSNRGSEKDWEDAICSVCMEFPHNAVLLLCSSYDKGCRPYMCATSRRYSNCLNQYKKAYTKAPPVDTLDLWSDSTGSIMDSLSEKTKAPELLCPLCRGQVKGWTVVEPARQCLNAKKRSCMHGDCKFLGSYKKLRKHVKAKHPLARTREVDPVLEEKWKRLERERERSDVISTIMSSTPGAVVLGDYVLEPMRDDFFSDFDSDDSSDDDNDNVVEGFDFEGFNLARNAASVFSRNTFRGDDDDDDRPVAGRGNFQERLSRYLGNAAAARNIPRIMFSRGRWRGGSGNGN